MKTIGFVNDIRRKDAKQIVTVVLNYEELEDNKLVLGEFIVVKSGAARKFLARVEDCYYAPVIISGDEANSALATGHMNSTMDESAAKRINFLHYDLALLGEISQEDGKFFAGVREVPSLLDVEVYRPNQKELQQIADAKVPGGNGPVEPFRLGVLQYGTREAADGSPALPPFQVNIHFNIANLQAKRTAVFGKTGYGKSNLIKTLITLSHKVSEEAKQKTAQLVFDVNGEYAFSNKQGDGLLDVFRKAGQTANIVVYTNRRDAQQQYGGEVVKPVKFDVIENPELAVSLVTGKRRQRNASEAGYLENLADPDMHETVRAFWRCFAVKEIGIAPASFHKAQYLAPVKYKKDKGLDEGTKHYVDDFDEAYDAICAYSSSETTKNLKGRSGQFSFLKRMHCFTGNEGSSSANTVDFFKSLKEDVAEGKIVIVDLPSLDSKLLAPLMDKIGSELFAKAQDNFLIGSVDPNATAQGMADVLMYVEEAHNVLSDEQNTIFPRIAREGRKYGIGMVYSTQRPGSINEDILTQSENFFVMHVGSEEDAMRLRRAKVAFASPITDFILTEPAVGVAFVYSEPYQPYVLSCKVRKFEDVLSSVDPSAT